MTDQLPETAELYLDGSRGQYIPQAFFEVTRADCINWTCDDETRKWILESCADPANEDYWEAWNEVEGSGRLTVTNPDTEVEYTLYQDGDLWLIPVNAEWPEEEEYL